MERYDCVIEICHKIDGYIDELRHIVMEEMLVQGTPLETAEFIASGMKRKESLMLLMEYMVSIRDKTIDEITLITESEMIKISTGESLLKINEN